MRRQLERVCSRPMPWNSLDGRISFVKSAIWNEPCIPRLFAAEVRAGLGPFSDVMGAFIMNPYEQVVLIAPFIFWVTPIVKGELVEGWAFDLLRIYQHQCYISKTDQRDDIHILTKWIKCIGSTHEPSLYDRTLAYWFLRRFSYFNGLQRQLSMPRDGSSLELSRKWCQIIA